MPRRWYVAKSYDGVLRDVAGPWLSYQTAHSYAAEMRAIYGRSGWLYAVTNVKPRLRSDGDKH